MSNVVDYLKDYKDNSFTIVKFNELDGLILSRLSYVAFDKLVTKKKIIKKKLKDVINDILGEDKNDFRFRLKEDKEILTLLKDSKRYSNLFISQYVKETNKEEIKQFSATTFLNKDKRNHFIFISYRGTDGTVTGWKEDFDMCYLPEIPSQLSAIKYAQKSLRFIGKENVYLGGHSKGWNLAIYAASNLKRKIKNKIKGIFVYDSPGFNDTFINSTEFKEIKNKITLFAPSSSVIGRLLNRDYKTVVVQSKKYMLNQHNVYNWVTKGTSFIVEPKFTYISDKIESLIKDNLDKLSLDEREEFVNELFKVVKVLSIDDVIIGGEGFVDFLKRFKDVLKDSSERTKKIILSVFNKNLLKDLEQIKKVSPNRIKKPLKIKENIENAYKKVVNKVKPKKEEPLTLDLTTGEVK